MLQYDGVEMEQLGVTWRFSEGKHKYNIFYSMAKPISHGIRVGFIPDSEVKDAAFYGWNNAAPFNMLVMNGKDFDTTQDILIEMKNFVYHVVRRDFIKVATLPDASHALDICIKAARLIWDNHLNDLTEVIPLLGATSEACE